MLTTLHRLSYMYSIYQFILTLIVYFTTESLPDSFADYVRASSVIIAIGWMSLYAIGAHNEIVAMYTSLYPWLKHQIILIYAIDFCIHILPFLVIGFPQDPTSYLIACGVILTWYTIVRNNWQKIYNILTTKKCDIGIYVLLPLLTIVLYLCHQPYRARISA